MAAGRCNQRFYIIPSLQKVVVRLGRDNLLWNDAEFLARLLKGRRLSAESGHEIHSLIRAALYLAGARPLF